MVPEGWAELDLDDCEYVVIDGDRGKEYPSQEDFRGDGYCLFLSAKNVTKSGFVFDDLQFIDKVKDSALRKGKLERNDIVLTTRGTTGNVALFADNVPYDNIRINSGMVILRNVGVKLSVEYLYVLFRSRIIERQIERLSFGSAQPQLTVKIIKGLRVPVPSHDEQSKIAKILSVWDHAIEVTEELIANSKAQKKALSQQLLTGKKHLSGHVGEWAEYRLDQLATVSMGSSPKSENYNEEGVGLPLLQGNADILDGRSRPRAFTSEITQVCEPGDILLSVRAPVGSVAVADHKACIGRGLASIKAKKHVSSTLLLEHLRNAESYWLKLSQGSTFEAVNSKDVRSLKLSLPVDRNEQEALGKILSSAQNEIEVLTRALWVLQLEKAALMQQLLTGKRRVKIEEAENA